MQTSLKFAVCLFAIATLIFVVPTVSAQTDAEVAAARDAIWAKEQRIYLGRAEGGLTFYLDNASDRYVGWPPFAPAPTDLSGLTATSNEMAGNNAEKLTMELVDFTLEGDTGVIYYQTHRTMLPDGTAVDQRWEVIHVWGRTSGDWKIFGAMARGKPDR